MADPFNPSRLPSRRPGRRYNYINLLGQRFGMLVVIAQSTKFYHGGSLWDCRCECGEVIQRPASRLRTELREWKEGKRKAPVACPQCVRKFALDKTGD